MSGGRRGAHKEGRARHGAVGVLVLAAAAAGLSAAAPGCSGDETPQTSSSTSTSTSTGTGSSQQGSSTAASTSGSSGSSSTTGGGGAGGAGGGSADPGPNVDPSDPQLYKTSFKPNEADPDAKEALNTQLAFLDTTVDPRGILVVYLHGAGAPSTCGSNAHGEMLAELGFHVLSPCYRSDYGIENCGDDIEGCRLEAFEGVDHHPFVDIKPPDSIETRVVKGLEHVQTKIPKGDWPYFLDGDKPKWSKIIISGLSHGASSSGVIGLHRLVHRVVSLSGPRDVNQAWLKKTPMTPIDRFFGFTHTDDGQHQEHLATFEDMNLPGEPIVVDNASPPYGGSHRLVTSAQTGDGHGSTQAGESSPKDVNDNYKFLPVWTYMYAGTQ